MVQGFSLGGEVGPTTAYLLEAAPPDGAASRCPGRAASQGIAATLGGLVGVGLSMVMPPDALDAYGWRIAFLLGAATLPFGLWIRRGLPETLHAPEPTGAPSSASRGFALLRENGRIVVLSLVALGSGTIGTYVFNYHDDVRPRDAAPAGGRVVSVGGAWQPGRPCSRCCMGAGCRTASDDDR